MNKNIANELAVLSEHNAVMRKLDMALGATVLFVTTISLTATIVSVWMIVTNF